MFLVPPIGGIGLKEQELEHPDHSLNSLKAPW